MTDIKSGYFPTPSTTPTGQPKRIAVDNPYVSRDEYLSSMEAQGLGIDSSHVLVTSGEIDKILLRASAWINRECRRWFDTQTIDETKTGFIVRPYNPQLCTVVLQNRPYQMIHRIDIQVLKFFINIDISSNASYLQDFSDYGYYKIVPLLSSAGTGLGSPIPAAILDRIALGVLWTRYTFGYGTPLTAQTLTGNAGFTVYQAPQGNRLWAPDQTTTIYVNAVPVTTGFTINYPEGKVTFTTPLLITDAVTADFITNESIPADLKEATLLVATHLIGQALQNPLGVSSYSIQTYSVSFGGVGGNTVKERIDQLLQPYKNDLPVII